MHVRSLLLALALVLWVCGCRSRDAPAPAASTTLPAPPAPEELLAELTLGNPKETWRRLRLLGGDAAQTLPSSLAVLLATSLSLPPAAAGNLDEGLPLVGALLSRPGSSEPDVVLGAHVLSGAELVASLTLGAAAKFRSLEIAPRVVRLLPAPGAPDFNGALAVSGNYLLLATRVEALKLAGRFVAETLPRRAPSEPGLRLRTNEKVLASGLSRTLRQAWQAQRARLTERARAEQASKGRPADFAEPEVLLAGVDGVVESWLSLLDSSRQLSLELVPEADRLRAQLTLAPAPGGAAEQLGRELEVGSLGPLLRLPAGTRAGLLMRGTQRPGELAFGASVARLFGERLQPEQAERLVTACDALARSCSPPGSRPEQSGSVVGLQLVPSKALLWTCEVTDGAAFEQAVGDALGLVQLPAVRDWLAGTVGKPTLTLSRAAGGPHSARLGLARAGRTGAMPSALYVSWQAREGTGYVTVSTDRALAPAELAVEPSLMTSTWLAQSAAQLADRTAVAVYVDARLLLPGGPEAAPILLSFGKLPDSLVVSLEAAPTALRAVAGVLR